MKTEDKPFLRRMAIGFGAAMFAIASFYTPGLAATQHPTTQQAQLYQMQAAFHRAATVHDPVNGDSSSAIDQRIRDMLALWSSDGSISLQVGGSHDGTYQGNGDPGNPATCPMPSGTANNQGTLCTFFKYVAGSFQQANKFVSLAPSYLTNFNIHGNTSTVYFQCHYFNVAIDPNTNKPLWTSVSHVVFDGSAKKVHGSWLFSHANSPVAGVPVP
jgi:hypothetical protein